MPDEKATPQKYPLLEFEYDKKPYEELLKLEHHPDFMDKVSIVTDEYLHDDFGLCTGDDQDALGHAAGVLKQIEEARASSTRRSRRRGVRHDPSIALLILELVDDFKNYCTCVRYGLGKKETLHKLMEAVLYYGKANEVYDEVMDWNKAANTGEPPYQETIFDFRSLFVKQGDRFLFLTNSVSQAMRFYHLASLKWNTAESSRLPHERSSNAEETYLLYTALSQGRPYYRTPLAKAPFFDLYNEIVSSKTPLYGSKRLSVLLSSFIDPLQSILNAPDRKQAHWARSGLLMVIALTQKYLITELAQLCEDEERATKKHQTLQKSKLLFSTPFDTLAQYAELFDYSGKAVTFDSYLLLAKAAYLSNLLLLELNAEDSPQPVAYYTSADVFSYMLPEKCTGEKKDRLGKLTVMHLSYMNDPNEGQTLRKALYGAQYSLPKIDGRKLLDVPYVFVKCFSPRIDYLPMWEMYGDHARGCCLVIDWISTKFWEENSDPTLYHVCYLRKTADGYTVDTEDNQALAKACPTISEQIEQLSKIASSLSDYDRGYFDSLLDKVLYLFKDSSYSYEQELRVIYQTKDNILHTDGDKPWLFVQTPFPLQLDEVILGPKFPDVSTRVPYLQEQIDKMCEKTGTEMPRITLSEIDYR